MLSCHLTQARRSCFEFIPSFRFWFRRQRGRQPDAEDVRGDALLDGAGDHQQEHLLHQGQGYHILDLLVSGLPLNFTILKLHVIWQP